MPPDRVVRVGGYYLAAGGRRHGAHERVTAPSGAAAPPVIAGPVIPETIAPEPPWQVPAVVAAPVPERLAASGLPVRIPQANRMPGPADPGPAEAPPSSVPPVTRSAEAARSRLGGYQRGTRRAEQQITRTGPRADQERADH